MWYVKLSLEKKNVRIKTSNFNPSLPIQQVTPKRKMGTASQIDVI